MFNENEHVSAQAREVYKKFAENPARRLPKDYDTLVQRNRKAAIEDEAAAFGNEMGAAVRTTEEEAAARAAGIDGSEAASKALGKLAKESVGEAAVVARGELSPRRRYNISPRLARLMKRYKTTQRNLTV